MQVKTLNNNRTSRSESSGLGCGDNEEDAQTNQSLKGECGRPTRVEMKPVCSLHIPKTGHREAEAARRGPAEEMS